MSTLASLGPICTARLGGGINRQGVNARTLLIDTAAQIVGGRMGYEHGGLSNVVWLEIKPETSGSKGHHNYQLRPGAGLEMKRLIDSLGLGYMSMSRYNGIHTGTASEARIVTWAVPGPISTLDQMFKDAFGKDYEKLVKHYANEKRW